MINRISKHHVNHVDPVQQFLKNSGTHPTAELPTAAQSNVARLKTIASLATTGPTLPGYLMLIAMNVAHFILFGVSLCLTSSNQNRAT